MNSILIYSFGLILCSARIAISGSKLAKYGDIIAELTGMDSPDIAVGGIMGSLSFHLVILAILDFFVPQKPLSSIITKSHVLAGLLGMILVSIAIIEILYSSLMPDIGLISTFPIVLIVLYVITVRLIFENERSVNVNIKIQD